MRILLALLGGFLLSTSAFAQTPDQTDNYLIWTQPQLAQLQQLVDARGAGRLFHHRFQPAQFGDRSAPPLAPGDRRC